MYRDMQTPKPRNLALVTHILFLGFLLIRNLLLSFVTSANISSGPPSEIRLNYKLFGGRHKSDTTPSTEVPEYDSSSDDSTFAPLVVAPRGAPSSSSTPPSSDTTFLAFLEDDLSILVAQAHSIDYLLRSNKEHQLVVFAKIAAIISGSQSVAPSVLTSSTPPPIIDPSQLLVEIPSPCSSLTNHEL